MPQAVTKPAHDHEARMQRRDPRLARKLEPGRRPEPRESRRRRGPAWALLTFSVALLVLGTMLSQSLLLAAGLVTAAMAMNLLTPPHEQDRPRRS